MHLTLPHAHEINILCATLFNSHLGFNVEELDTALKNLPLQELGTKAEYLSTKQLRLVYGSWAFCPQSS